MKSRYSAVVGTPTSDCIMVPPAAKKARKGNTVDSGSRRRVRRHQHGPRHCDCCGDSIPSDGDHIQNIPCHHDVCLLCVVKSNMKRGPNPACCQVEGCQHKYTTMCQYYKRGSPVEVIKNEEVGNDRFRNKFLPMNCLMDDHLDEMKEGNTNKDLAAVIYVGSIQKENNGQCRVSCFSRQIVIEKTKDGYDYADDTVDKVLAIFANIHPIIVPASKPHRTTDNPVLSAREYLEHRIMYPPLILHALFGLSTGISHFDQVKEKIWEAGSDPSHQNQFLAAAGAADMLLRSSDRKPNCFQLMLGEYLSRFPLSKEVKNLLSALQVTPSQNFSLLKRSEKVLEKLETGLKIGPHDLVFILADNIGFRVKGQMASYDQHTIVNVMVVPAEKLRAAGVYDDDPTKRLSREPNLDWRNAIDEAKGDEDKIKRLIDLIVGLDDDDYNRLGESVMEDILLAVEYTELLRHNDTKIVNKKMPRIDRICNKETRDKWNNKLLESEQEKHQHNDQQTSISPPAQSCVMKSVSIARDTASESTDLDPKCKNRYDLNNASLESLHEDLAKNATQQRLMQYITSTCQQQVKEFDKQNHSTNEERPVAEIFACLGVDGQPAAACHQILAHDATSDSRKYPEHLLVSAGGFHYGMKTLNANGELFEQAIDMFLSAWRDTIPRQEWFKFPSDPRQRKNEHSWFLIALCAVAVVQLSDSEDGRDVSAHDVYEFMLQRAKEYPLCMLVLLEMRLATVAKMMNNAERIGERGSVELFLTSVKFAMRLFAMTHKTDYMRLSCNILLWWNCASDAQKKIYSSFIFTQLTSNGVPIYHDLSVELSVKDLRQILGKVYKKGLDLYMEHACATIPERDAQQLEATELRNKDAPSQSSTSKSYSTIPEDFSKMYTRIRDMDLWTPGKAPILARPRGRDTLYAQPDRLEVPVRGGGAIHASVLESITTHGEKRVRDYFRKNYIDFNNRPDRSETNEEHGVSLSKMTSTVKQLQAQKDLRIRRATASTKAQIKKIMKIDDIIEEYNKLRDDNKQLKLSKLRRSGMNHEAYAAELGKARTKLFKKEPRLKESITDEINQEYRNNELSTEDDRVSLLKDKLFTFPQSTTNTDRYTKKINVMPKPM